MRMFWEDNWPVCVLIAAVVVLFAGYCLLLNRDAKEMGRLHCKRTGASEEYTYFISVVTGKDSYMLVPVVGIHYEYACDNGVRWR